MVVALLAILLGILMPSHLTYAAASLNPAKWPGIFLAWANETMLSFAGEAISRVAEALKYVISSNAQKLATGANIGTNVVEQSWTIIRDFVNMFFILFLIIMAFGTIFDIQKYNWKNLLPSFLVAALLVNFSLAISRYVIELGNGLSSVFLSQISGFTTDLGAGLALGKSIPPGNSNFAFGAINSLI